MQQSTWQHTITKHLFRKIRLLLVLVTVFSFSFQRSARAYQNHQEWSYNLAIYEVNVRQYTPAGTFAAFASHLDRLKEMGVGILWFMPIHPIGEQNRLGSLGSYYSVKDYLAVNPEFGTMDEFKALVQKIHDMDMFVIIDWVANHTAWDNPLATEHPEWYNKDANGNFIPPPGTNWSDVIDLDYFQQGLRDYMINAMKFWVEEVGVDGFRCDAASFVPLNFWREAINELRKTRPDIFMLAEADNPVFHYVGFDMTFAWKLYGFGGGVLKNIAAGSSDVGALDYNINKEMQDYSRDAYRMYFTSNHDENSWHGTTYELFGDAAEVFAVLTATFNGMPLIYSGQEAGLNKRLKFFDKDQIEWREHKNAQLYTTLLHLKRKNKALWNGENGGVFQRVKTSNDAAVFAFVREKENDKIFVVLNLSHQQQSVTLAGSLYVGNYSDAFTGETISFSEGAEITLPAWGYKVCHQQGATTGVEINQLPMTFRLGQNYPNPFNPVTTISYTLPAQRRITLTLFDVLGRQVRVLAAGSESAGSHTISFDATGLSSGVYFYRFRAGNYVETKRLTLLK